MQNDNSTEQSAEQHDKAQNDTKLAYNLEFMLDVDRLFKLFTYRIIKDTELEEHLTDCIKHHNNKKEMHNKLKHK